MSRTYWKIAPAFWTDEKVLTWSDDAKLLALYLMTCPHRTLEGLFRLPKPYIMADMGWSVERLGEPFAKLLAEGFICYDEAVSVIFICNALNYQAPENPNQVTAAVRFLEELPETYLFAGFLEQAKRFAKGLAEGLPERFHKPFGKPPTPTPTPTPISKGTGKSSVPLSESNFVGNAIAAAASLGVTLDAQTKARIGKAAKEQAAGGAPLGVINMAILRLLGEGKSPSVLGAIVRDVQREVANKGQVRGKDGLTADEYNKRLFQEAAL